MKNPADEYETITSIDEHGNKKKKTVYRGSYCEISLDETGLQQFRRSSIVLLLGIIILHFFAGFVSNQGMYQFFIGLPYTISYFPLLYLGMGIFRLPKKKRKYQNDEIQHSFDRMRTYGIILLVILGMGVVGEIVFIVLFPLEKWGLEVLYLVLELVSAAAAFLLVRMRQRVTVQPSSE